MGVFLNEKMRSIILSWSLVGVLNEKRSSIIFSWSLVGFFKKNEKRR